jgi:hypothetical protein
LILAQKPWHNFTMPTKNGIYPSRVARVSLIRILTCFLFVSITSSHSQAQTMTVELELVLAVDVSSSVSAQEYMLQVQGLGLALRDPTVVSAIAGVGSRGIALSVIQWASSRQQIVALDWTRLTSPETIYRIADAIYNMPRTMVGGDTRIGDAIRFATLMLMSNNIASARQVIDIAGDGGAEVMGIARSARDDAVVHGITINGLAIENEVPDLAVFFLENVIGGSGSFVIRIGDYGHFTDAMRRKLFREISNRPQS